MSLLDEALELHERISITIFKDLDLQDRMAHYQAKLALWEVIFAPLFIAIGLLMFSVLFGRRHRGKTASWLGLAALGLWALALITGFFKMTYFVHTEIWFGAAIWVKETLEILAFSLFLVATVLIFRGRLGRDREGLLWT